MKKLNSNYSSEQSMNVILRGKSELEYSPCNSHDKHPQEQQILLSWYVYKLWYCLLLKLSKELQSGQGDETTKVSQHGLSQNLWM